MSTDSLGKEIDSAFLFPNYGSFTHPSEGSVKSHSLDSISR